MLDPFPNALFHVIPILDPTPSICDDKMNWPTYVRLKKFTTKWKKVLMKMTFEVRKKRLVLFSSMSMAMAMAMKI